MKKLLSMVLMLALPLMTLAQCKYKTNKVDEFTGDRTIVTKPSLVGQSTESSMKLYYSHILSGTTQAGRFTLSYDINVGCAASDSYVQIKFTDGTTEKFMNVSDISCKDSPPIILMYLTKTGDDIIDKLTERTPEMIRIYYTKGYVTFNVTDPEVFRTLRKCVEEDQQ